jgi:HEAT repeat protein
MPDIFISYCHDDADFAHVLSDQLKQAGFSTWKDDAMNAGANWRAEIDKRISNAAAVVVILSPASKNSAYVQYEWAFALGAGVPLIPVLIKVTTAELHPRMEQLHGLDFTHYLNRPWDTLVDSLKKEASAQRRTSVRLPGDAPIVVQEAARALDSMNAPDREAAISSLGEMNHPAAVEVLAEAVRHPIRKVRFAAAMQLAKHHDVRALPAMIEAVRSEDKEIKSWMIGEIGPSAVTGLADVLLEHNPVLSRVAIDALGSIKGSQATAVLIGCLQDSDPSIRARAASALSRIADPAAFSALRELVHDSASDVRDNVAEALASCGGVSALPDLLELLRDPERNVRNSAAYRLESLADISAIPALLAALNDEDDQVGAKAAKALDRIADPTFIPDLTLALGNESSLVRHYVSDAIRRFGSAAVPTLREAMHHENRRVRAEALKLLSTLGDETDVPRFLAALGDASAAVRFYAVRALGNTKAPEVTAAVIGRLRDDDEDVRREAAEAVQTLRDPSAVPALIESLEDEAVASAAAEALKAIGTREARAALKAWKASGAG